MLGPGRRCEEHEAGRQRRRRASKAACAAQVLAEPVCADCGATDDLTAEHPWPQVRGGSDRHLVTLCRSCNAKRGTGLALGGWGGVGWSRRPQRPA